MVAKAKQAARGQTGGPRRTATAAAAESGPRYLQVARELKRAITDGTFPVGSHLPTELALCEQFGISRFTARDAVRVLSSAGLVTRRPRVGTVVVATPGEGRFTQDAASLRELLQYAQDTELRFIYIGRVALSTQQAHEFGAEPGAEWIFAIGIRYPGTADAAPKSMDPRPICITRLFLNPQLKGIDDRLREGPRAVYALIERSFTASIERVEQDIYGVVLDAGDAANLQATPGAPALRVVRRYYGDDGKLLEVADSVHPADRFSYHMQMRK